MGSVAVAVVDDEVLVIVAELCAEESLLSVLVGRRGIVYNSESAVVLGGRYPSSDSGRKTAFAP